VTDFHSDMRSRWTPTEEQDRAAHAVLTLLDATNVQSCAYCGQFVAQQTGEPWFHLVSGEASCAHRSTVATPDSLTVVTAHLMVGKQHGWWGDGIEVEAIAGVFADRNEASKALEMAGRKRHEETGKPVSGGWTYHHFQRQGSPDRETSFDGRTWLTHWSVFEDILCEFPEPARRSRTRSRTAEPTGG
jgi:hypothetical protein